MPLDGLLQSTLNRFRLRFPLTTGYNIAGASAQVASMLPTTANPASVTAPPIPSIQSGPQPCPATPKSIEDRQFKIGHPIQKEDEDKAVTIVAPFTDSFDLNPDASECWMKCVSPEGKAYYRHQDAIGKGCPLSDACCERRLTILTNNNMTKKDQRERIESATKKLLGRISHGAIALSAELVLDLSPFNFDHCDYYFAHKAEGKQPVVFWADEVDIRTVSGEFDHPVLSNSHLALAIETQYWIHVQMFPAHRPIPRGLKEDLLAYLLFAHSDVLTSKLSTSYFNSAQISAFTKIIENSREDDESGYSLWALARPMYYLKYKMFENYHGEHCARLSVDQSIYPPEAASPIRSWLLRVVSVFLFWIPDQSVMKLQKIWVDNILCTSRWNEFLAEKRKEWEKTITPATVLLSANVGFLAVSSVDTDHSPHARSAAQIASYCSTLLCLGSYITGHVLSLQHSRETRDGDTEVTDADYLMRADAYKVDRLAIIYSLPSALFMWSMAAFLAAMCWVFFDDSDTITRAVIAIIFGILFLVVLTVMVVEGAANTIKDTLRYRLCTFVVDILWIKR